MDTIKALTEHQAVLNAEIARLRGDSCESRHPASITVTVPSTLSAPESDRPYHSDRGPADVAADDVAVVAESDPWSSRVRKWASRQAHTRTKHRLRQTFTLPYMDLIDHDLLEMNSLTYRHKDSTCRRTTPPVRLPVKGR
jgi:hypothetical protein